MNAALQESRCQSGRRPASAAVCPMCGAAVAADAKCCPSCNFTGGDTIAMFPDPAPPLLPVLDAAALWSADDVRNIEMAREKLRRRFPQFHFHVCSVMLPPEIRLPVFGFWLLNVCPFYVNETAEDRAWTVLLLINAKTGQAAVIPGYSAEHWLGDDEWKKVIASMAGGWKSGKTAEAVIRYFENSATFLDHTWKLRGLRRSVKSKS